MKSIQQQVNVTFNAVEVQDVVDMLPIMNELARKLNSVTSNSEETPGEVYKWFRQYRVLSKLGFVSTIPVTINVDIMFQVLGAAGMTVPGDISEEISPMEVLQQVNLW